MNASKEKNGIVPIMGRVTINGSVAQFSCKLTIAKTMWDVKGNRAKGKSKESRDINLALDNIKAQIIKHYQRISDREAFVTAEMVRNAYQGIGTEYETLLRAFDKENEAFAKRVGPENTWQDMMRQPSPLPVPPATPLTPIPLLFTAATVPATWVPWLTSPGSFQLISLGYFSVERKFQP